ncbi:MAG: glycosyltransferase [Bacteroidaceae bacterium]|nr:glycosyltransferase [Bacteroidaceae bacterium]
MNLAPVILFVYNRADNTRETLRHLLANTLARETELYVFSDGGKDDASWNAVREVRKVLHEMEAEVARARTLKEMIIVERPTNYYLERNVLEGIAEVLRTHDRFIVLEDDICAAPHFLEFMNQALECYNHEKKVMHVAGFTRIESAAAPTTYFTPFMAGWGWGSWRDRWQEHFRHFTCREEALEGLAEADLKALEYEGVFPCLKHLDRKPIPWDVCWNIQIHKAGGLCLYPTRTLVRNIGLESGTHYGLLPSWCTRLLQRYEYDREPYEGPIAVEFRQPTTDPAIEQQMHEALTDWGIRYTLLGKIIRKIYRLTTARTTNHA